MSEASSVGTAARPLLCMAAFVRDIVAAADQFGRDDLDRARAAMAGPIHRLVERDDLLDAGIPRPGNNVAESYYLYFDGEVSVVLFKVPTGSVALLWATRPGEIGRLRAALPGAQVLDIFGNELPAPDGELTVPLGAAPVYVTTTQSTVLVIVRPPGLPVTK